MGAAHSGNVSPRGALCGRRPTSSAIDGRRRPSRDVPALADSARSALRATRQGRTWTTALVHPQESTGQAGCERQVGVAIHADNAVFYPSGLRCGNRNTQPGSTGVLTPVQIDRGRLTGNEATIRINLRSQPTEYHR